MDRTKIEIISDTVFSALYYGLLQSGYTFYALGRDRELMLNVQSFIRSTDVHAFWKGVKRTSCDVYPYWPRAFMLEAALFYIDQKRHSFVNFLEYQKHILDMTNIENSERENEFWDWIKDYPNALLQVMNSEGFLEYLQWEKEWIAEQKHLCSEELCLLQNYLSVCTQKYQSSVNFVRVILNPIKCIYSADYHLHGKCLTVTLGRFSVDSILHEFLHQVVHPVLIKNCEHVHSVDKKFPGVDASYYLDKTDAGNLSAIEEYVVRQLTDAVVRGNYPNDLDMYVNSWL